MSRFVLTAQLQLQAPNNVSQVVRQIQNQLNGVTVNVQVQGSAQAQRQIQQITNQTNQCTSAATRMGRAFAVSIRRFAAFSIATRAVGLFTSTLSDAIQTAIDFERQLIKVSQVTGKSVSQLSDLTGEITRLSTSLGVSSQSLLDVSTILAQAGLTADDTKVALNSLAKAALAPNFDSITETAEGAIAILAQFKQGVGALEGQLGSINAVAGAFAVEASDLIDVIRRTGGVFKSSGGSLNELLALFTSVRATTRESAESIGTGLRTIFTRIQRPKTIEYLKRFGVELVDLEGKFVGPYEAVRRLSGALAGLGDGDITFIQIAEELGGFRQIGKVLPLLQQFSTAQAALNVATRAGNSLSSDAASAQAALAIKIMKVKEEFLALVRSITETSTFQVMANTALQLASALIRIADAIKPLLPMLAALAAVKIARGIGSFAGAMMGGLTSGRAFNKGGRVHAFARGGMVPGSGNRDTVPAMLSPGEFVIRQSSVNKIGAGTLAAMNENKFALGGEVSVGAAVLKGRKSTASSTISYEDILSSIRKPEAKERLKTVIPPTKTFSLIKDPLNKEDFQVFDEAINNGLISAVNSANSILSKTLKVPTPAVDKNQVDNFVKGLNDASRGNLFETILTSMMNQGVWDSNPDPQRPFDFMKSTGQDISTLNVNGRPLFPSVSGLNYVDAKASMEAASKESMAKKIANQLLVESKGIQSSKQEPEAGKKYTSKELQAMGYTAGKFQESGFKVAGRSKGKPLYSLNSANHHSGGLIQKFATGGGVGTDTIPALLTPGEFVVNRKSAQNIGYGNLNRMNKVGRYATGGVVQHFGVGTSGSGAQPILSNFSVPGFDTKAPTMLNKVIAKLTGTFSLMDVSMARGIASFNFLATNAPALAKAIKDYAIANNMNRLEAAQLSAAYLKTLASMQRKGASDDKLQATVDKYINALNGNMPTPTGPRGGSGGGGGSGSGGSSGNRGVVGAVQDNKMFAASMVTSLIQGFLPAIDQNSSALLKMSHQFLGLVTVVASVGFALEAFGMQLSSKSIIDFFSGRGGSIVNKAAAYSRAGTSAVGRGLTNVGGRLASHGGMVGKAGGMIEGLGTKVLGNVGNIGKVVSHIGKLAGPAILATGAIYAFSSMIDSATDYQGKLNKAIEKGNVAEAGKMSVEKAGAEAVNNLAMGITAVGSVIPVVGPAFAALAGATLKVASEIPVIGPAIKSAAIWIGTWFGGKSEASIKAMAEASAQAAKTTKALEQGQIDASKAMEEFKNGSISAVAALGRIQGVQQEVNTLGNKTSNAMQENNKNKGGFLRETGAYLSLGYMDSNEERNKKIDTENADQNKTYLEAQRRSFSQSSELRNAAIRSTIARGGTTEDAASKLGEYDPNKLRAQAAAAGGKAIKALQSGDEATADAYIERQKLLSEQAREVEQAMENIAKEVQRAKAAFEALNLGLRGPEATATAMSASLNKFAAGLEVGGNQFVNNTQFLSDAMSSAAQAMNPDEIKSAIKNVKDNLLDMGVSPQYAAKFEANTNAFVQAQQNYTKAFENIKAKNPEFKQMSPEQLQKAFAEELTVGLGDDAKKNLTAIIDNMNLSQGEVDDILGGNLQVFGDKLGEAGKKQFEQIMKIAEERQKAEKVLIDLTKQRIDAERNYVDSVKQAIDLKLEGRELQGKYGGKQVTTAERKAAIVDKANAGAERLGLTKMSGNATMEDFARRRKEIKAGFSDIEGRRSKQGGMDGVAGTEMDAKQKDLDAAVKDQISTVRELVKLEEENLKLVQEKNKLEKQSLESLVNGDIDKFFEQQAAVGATAAIATGNKELMNAFGGQALGGAYSDIQRQQEAGVQSLYGRQLAGQGGLVEQSASAALGARGITNPLMAQQLAGTTPEEEASRARLRELGGELGNLGDLGQQMAEMQVKTATMNVENATIELAKIEERGREAAAGMARGGVVYASRGIFVPRGTDTVPAMLTPGEFVVNRGAVNRGNNLQILQAMNGNASPSAAASVAGGTQGLARGGSVQYLAGGGLSSLFGGMVPDFVTDLSKALNSFVTQMSDNIKSLQDIKFKVTLDSTNINVNVNGMTAGITDQVKEEIAQKVAAKIRNNYSVGQGGKLTENTSTLPK